jgi:hypothetical protein
LEQLGDAAGVSAPELGKASDAAIPDTVPATIGDIESSVLPKVPTPIVVETSRIETRARDASPEMLASEPIVPPPPAGSNLPVARLLTRCKVTRTPQHSLPLEIKVLWVLSQVESW